jgi:hypothetical protein
MTTERDAGQRSNWMRMAVVRPWPHERADSRSSRRLPVARAAALAQARREDVWQGGLRNSGPLFRWRWPQVFLPRKPRTADRKGGQGYGKTANSCGGRWIYHLCGCKLTEPAHIGNQLGVNLNSCLSAEKTRRCRDQLVT